MSKSSIRIGLVCLFVLSAVLILGRSVWAAGNVCTWDGSTGIWSDPAHWSNCNGHAPDSSDTAVIGNGWAAVTETVTILNLDLNGGHIALASGGPASILNVTGVFNWTSGDLQSGGLTVNLLPGSTTWVNQNAPTRLEATLNNSGTLTLNKASGIASLNGGGVINNYGAFTILTGTLGIPTINNKTGGTLNINLGTGGQLQFIGQFNNAGIVNVQSGRPELSGGGTQTGAFNLTTQALVLDGMQVFYFNPGIVFSGEGWLGWGGAALEINTPLTLTNLHVGYGTIGGYGPLTVTQHFHWDQGTLQGLTLNLPPGAQAIADNDGTPTYLQGGTINNRGTFTLTHDQGITSNYGGGTINNEGTFTLQKGSFYGAAFNNLASGTLNVAPSLSSVLMNAPLNNGGTVKVLSGTLNINNIFAQDSGATILSNSSIVKTYWMAALNLNGGTLRGTGSITSDVTQNGGSIAPGQSAGALTIDGNYTQAANGALNIELGGVNAETQYDVLHVTGSASLGGRLNVSAINSFVPVTGTTFQVLTYGSRSGQFTAVNGLSLTDRVTLTPQFHPTDLMLLAIESSKADQTIAFDPLPDRTWGDPAFIITATASSGLTVTFTASGTCSINNTLVTLINSGRCDITAHQNGDANTNAALDVTRSFNVWRKLYLPFILK